MQVNDDEIKTINELMDQAKLIYEPLQTDGSKRYLDQVKPNKRGELNIASIFTINKN